MKNAFWSTVAHLVIALALPAGLLLVWLSGSHLAYRLGLRGELISTTGQVAAINTWTESGDTYESPTVRFTTERGEPIAVDMWCPPIGCFWHYNYASKLPVAYPRDHPREALAATPLGWISDVFLLVVGTGVAAFGWSVGADLFRRKDGSA